MAGLTPCMLTTKPALAASSRWSRPLWRGRAEGGQPRDQISAVGHVSQHACSCNQFLMALQQEAIRSKKLHSNTVIHLMPPSPAHPPLSAHQHQLYTGLGGIHPRLPVATADIVRRRAELLSGPVQPALCRLHALQRSQDGSQLGRQLLRRHGGGAAAQALQRVLRRVAGQGRGGGSGSHDASGAGLGLCSCGMRRWSFDSTSRGEKGSVASGVSSFAGEKVLRGRRRACNNQPEARRWACSAQTSAQLFPPLVAAVLPCSCCAHA